ncbi:MAG: hypothetical protein M3N07_09620 [Pseudomonadota bacterium]|nr:hypothetical protein [Pseudomonadota bacterium]
MRLLTKLHNPFALVAQGFALGAILFFSTHPAPARRLPPPSPRPPRSSARTGSARDSLNGRAAPI